jgi:hypothetical protein
MLIRPTWGLGMILPKTFIALAAGTLLIGVSPAHAQHRGGGGNSRNAGGGSHRAAPRASAPQSFRAPRVYSAPRTGPVGPRAYSSASPRAYSYGQRVYGAGPRGAVVVGRSAPRILGPRVFGVAPGRFYRPYYTFRPRLSLGFGLWVGFPIAYPYYYGYYDPYYSPYGYPGQYPPYPYRPYPYSYPYPYPYPSTSYPTYPTSTYPQYSQYPPAPGSVAVQPGQSQANTGGVSFEITPSTAQVFIDGSYVGTVGEFTPTTQPIGLTPGRHRIEIRARGYRTMELDADIVAGQVIPYQGVLER